MSDMDIQEIAHARESLISYVKPGSTLYDVLTKAHKDGVALPSSLQVAAINIYKDWVMTHYPHGPEELRKMFIESKKNTFSEGLLEENVQNDEIIYHVKGIIHPNTTGRIEGDKKQVGKVLIQL